MTILRMERKHIKPVSLMLSRVFKDELKDVFPDPDERRRKEPYVNEFLIRRSYSYSEAFITSPQLEGVVVWSYSDKRLTRNSFWRTLTSGAIWQAIKIGCKPLKKMETFDKYVEKKHSELAPFKHWYLAVLGVDPLHQGKGYGSKLLNEMLSRIDEGGLPCYVETEGEKNVSMYQHFGFQILDEFVVPNTTEKMAAMLREPKKQSKET